MFVDLLLSSAPSVEDASSALSEISGSPPNDVSVVELVIADLSKLKPPVDTAFKPSLVVRKLKPPPVSDPPIVGTTAIALIKLSTGFGALLLRGG